MSIDVAAAGAGLGEAFCFDDAIEPLGEKPPLSGGKRSHLSCAGAERDCRCDGCLLCCFPCITGGREDLAEYGLKQLAP